MALSPTMSSFRRARVMATFMRRMSPRKPISPLALLRTKRDHHRLLLAALKAVDAVDLQARHVEQLAKQADLRPIGRDYRDVAGGNARFEQLADLARDQFGLLAVQPALAVGLKLFVVAGAGRVDELNGPLGRAARRPRRAGRKADARGPRHGPPIARRKARARRTP